MPSRAIRTYGEQETLAQLEQSGLRLTPGHFWGCWVRVSFGEFTLKKLLATTSVLAISFVSPATAECVLGDDKSCISAGVFSWEGPLNGEAGDYLESENWRFGGLFGAPSGLPTFVGVGVQRIQGFFSEFLVPNGTDLVLDSDFTADVGQNFTMGAGIDTNFEINGATLNQGVISGAGLGDLAALGAPTDVFTNEMGTSTIDLNSSHFGRQVVIGQDTRAVLNVSGTSTGQTVTLAENSGSVGTLNIAAGASFDINRLNIGDGTATINNLGSLSANNLEAFASLGGAGSIFNNFSGADLDFSGAQVTSLRGDGQLINQEGATVTMQAGRFSASSVNFVNDGLLNVVGGGRLAVSNYSGDGEINVGPQSDILLSGELSEDTSVTLSGDGGLAIGLEGSGRTLALDGDWRLVKSGFPDSIGVDITNAGNGTIDFLVQGSRNNDGSIRNLDGATLTLKDSVGFRLNGREQKLINDEGGTVIAQTRTNFAPSVAWEFENNGLFDIQSGRYTLGNISGSGTVRVREDAQVGLGNNVKQNTIRFDDNRLLSLARDQRLEVVNLFAGLDQQGGVFAPGASPAESFISGDYLLGTAGILEIEFAGTTEGLFDHLTVGGDVFLNGGSLSLLTLDMFSFNSGSMFEFLTVEGSLFGEFDGLGEGDLVGNFGSDVFITYTAGDGNDIAFFTEGTAVAPVPLPAGLPLLLTGLGGALLLRRRKV